MIGNIIPRMVSFHLLFLQMCIGIKVAHIPKSARVRCLLLFPPEETNYINPACVRRSNINSTNKYPSTGVIAPTIRPVKKLSLSMRIVYF